MYMLTAMELWGMVVAAFVSAGASYLAGKWRAEVVLRHAINMRKEISALPGWQPVMMELHISGYDYKKVAGELHLPKEFVLRELTKAYSALRARERMPKRTHALRTQIISQLVRRFT